MGARHSAMKKELETLKRETRQTAAKHKEELEAVVSEKQLLQRKLDEAQQSSARAQVEVEQMKEEAHQREERMKALKWELIRQLKISGASTSPSDVRASLPSSPSSSPRISLNWRLNGDVLLRQSATSPKRTSNNASGFEEVEGKASLPRPASSSSVGESLAATVGSAQSKVDANAEPRNATNTTRSLNPIIQPNTEEGVKTTCSSNPTTQPDDKEEEEVETTCSSNPTTQPDVKEEKEVETTVAIMSSESGSDSEDSNDNWSSYSSAKMSRFKFGDDAAASKSEKATTPSREEVTGDAKVHDDSESEVSSSSELDDVLTFSDDEETSS